MQVEIKPCDMGKREDIDKLLYSLKDDKIGCVINAAGITHKIPNELY